MPFYLLCKALLWYRMESAPQCGKNITNYPYFYSVRQMDTELGMNFTVYVYEVPI